MTDFINTYYPFAISSGSHYHLDPVFILAQAAVESGWGTSRNAQTPNNNFFGMTATHSWKGRSRLAGTGLRFRCYDHPQQSFDDFARLITTRYKEAAAAKNLEEYAHRIAYSPYISESNGDNRPQYEHNILSAGHRISRLIAARKF